MKKYLNWRIITLALMSIVALVLILGEPTATDTGAWLATFILTKGIGAAICYCIYRLAIWWRNQLNF